MRKSSLEIDGIDVAINREISTDFDTVKTVADNLAEIISIAQLLEDPLKTAILNAAVNAATAQTAASEALASETAAEAAKLAAETAQTAAEIAYDDFDDRYLGPKATEPTTDNDGDVILEGALYYNTSSFLMYVYNGTVWVDFLGNLALLRSNNLSDLTDFNAARTNLQVETTAELNTRDVNNRDRDNHTGLQSIDTIVDSPTHVKVTVEEQALANVTSQTSLHGIISASPELISINTNTELFDVAAFDYYLEGTKYTYTGSTGNSTGFVSGDSFLIIGVNSGGLYYFTKNSFPTVTDKENNILEIGGIATQDGINISNVGSSFVGTDQITKDLFLWSKFAKKTDFINGTGKISEGNSRELDVVGGYIVTPELKLEQVTAETSLNAIPYYHVSGVWELSTTASPLVVPNTQYDNGTGLVTATDSYYLAHTLLRSSRTNSYYLVYSQDEYASLIEARSSVPSLGGFEGFSGSDVEFLAHILIQKDAITINDVVDLRGHKLGYEDLQTADETSYDNTVSSLTANNVKSGLDELQANKADISLLNSNITTYATTATGDFGYNRLVTSTDDTDYDTVAVDVPTGTITTANQFISGLIADAGLFEGDPGIINIPTIGNIQKTSGGVFNNASFYFEVYKRSSGGTETLLATSSTTADVSSTSYEQFSANALVTFGTWLASDRLVIKYYGNTGAFGADPEYNFQFGGSQPVRTSLPVPVSVTPAATALGTSYDNATSGLTASNVKDALDEIVAETGTEADFVAALD